MKKERLLNILLKPHITNKSYKSAKDSSCVVFKVMKNSTKKEIKNAVENLFDVKIDSIRTLNVKGHICNINKKNKIKGKTKDWKKAYVKLTKGHDISFVE